MNTEPPIARFANGKSIAAARLSQSFCRTLRDDRLVLHLRAPWSGSMDKLKRLEFLNINDTAGEPQPPQPDLRDDCATRGDELDILAVDRASPHTALVLQSHPPGAAMSRDTG